MVKMKIHLDRKKSLGEQIYFSLREKIISTELYPLTEISEGELSKIINVSRTPIRDALKKLENEGLINTIPQVKSIVSKINTNQISEANKIRSVLETNVVEQLSSKINSNQIKKLKQINLNILDNLKKKNYRKVFYFDNMFHQTLAIQAKMPISWKIISQINTQIDRVRNISYLHEDDNTFGPLQAIKDHQEIVKHLSSKDMLKVVQSMKKHISSLERYTDFIKKTIKYKDIIN